MAFDVYDCLYSLVPLERLAAIDAKLADQLRRAAFNSEANLRTGGDRRNRFRIALGSAAEVASWVDVAVALGYGVGTTPMCTRSSIVGAR